MCHLIGRAEYLEMREEESQRKIITNKKKVDKMRLVGILSLLRKTAMMLNCWMLTLSLTLYLVSSWLGSSSQATSSRIHYSWPLLLLFFLNPHNIKLDFSIWPGCLVLCCVCLLLYMQANVWEGSGDLSAESWHRENIWVCWETKEPWWYEICEREITHMVWMKRQNNRHIIDTHRNLFHTHNKPATVSLKCLT